MLLEPTYIGSLFLDHVFDPNGLNQRRTYSVSMRLYERAKKTLHGYSSQTKLAPVVFEGGINELLYDADENWYIDFTSGTYCSALGHGNIAIANGVHSQLLALSNCHSWLTRTKLSVCERLSKTLPERLSQFEFYSDGTTAVEASLRLVHLHKPSGVIVSFTGAFHGKSTGAAMLTERPSKGSIPIASDPERNEPNFVRLPYPAKGSGITQVELGRALREIPRPIAGIFVEPIQGVKGCIEPEDWFLPQLSHLCNLEGILLVVDEIFTGGMRTGKMWSHEGLDVDPAIVIFGKILGGGLPLSGLAMRSEVADLLEGSSTTTTYGGNPVSLAACEVALDILEHPELQANVLEIENVLRSVLSNLPFKIRGRGCMFGFDLPFDGSSVFLKLIEKGVLTQIEGSTVRLCPPLTSRPEIIQIGAVKIVETIWEEYNLSA
jgi:4-aminobutyrate aminotransferase-like enzyme